PTSSPIPRKRLAVTGCWMRCGATITIPARGPWTRTSFISGRSSSQILRRRVSFLPFMAVVTNSSDEVDAFMSQPAFNGGLGTRPAADLRLSPPRRRTSVKERRQELEYKLDALQKDYAELHTAIFEAAQVHRRLCAPRLLRYEDVEIASE